MTVVRRGEPSDLPAIRAIQDASPQASQWDAVDYLGFDLRVAEHDGRLAGFAVSRTLAPSESEILNLAVAPEFRRLGVARSLVAAIVADCGGALFLEVRSSNAAARSLYKALGFEEVTSRPGYYEEPREAAIVMKFHSC